MTESKAVQAMSLGGSPASDLKQYDAKYIGQAHGMQNTGVICYFNSLLQSMLSCSSFNELFLTDKTVSEKNDVCRAMHKLIRASVSGDSSATTLNIALFNTFVSAMRAAKKGEHKGPKGQIIQFGSGGAQEDSTEGFHLLMDALGSQVAIENLFEQRYLTIVVCQTCKRECSTTKDAMFMVDLSEYDVKATPGSGQQTEFNFNTVISQLVPIDEGLVCKVCGNKGPKTQLRQLVCMPEIFVAQFKKYGSKWEAKFPERMTIDLHTHKQEYRLVAQTEHSGSTGGGHYWARCLRNSAKGTSQSVFNLNDSSATQSRFESTPETYMVWYHAGG